MLTAGIAQRVSSISSFEFGRSEGRRIIRYINKCDKPKCNTLVKLNTVVQKILWIFY
jgi:hypothetical protein